MTEFLDSGGQMPQATIWDISTGEQLRYKVDVPTNAAWLYQQGFVNSQPQANFTSVIFHRSFRMYTIAPNDIILLRVDKLL